MYDNGDGVPENDAEALKWFRLAAEQGNADAQYNLGVMYQYGRGVPKDVAEAAKWFRLAAQQGDAKTQSNLGVILDTARGTSMFYYIFVYIVVSAIAAIAGLPISRIESIPLRRLTYTVTGILGWIVFVSALGAFLMVGNDRSTESAIGFSSNLGVWFALSLWVSPWIINKIRSKS